MSADRRRCVRTRLSVQASILECMFESEARVADWERTGRVPVPAEFLAPPDLTERVAAGPPPVDEITDSELLAPSKHGDRGADGDGTADGDRAPHAREGVAPTPLSGRASLRAWCWPRC